MRHALESNQAEVRVGVGSTVLAICTDRPSLLPSLLDKLPSGWRQTSSLGLDRCYVLWAETAPFRLDVDRARLCEGTDLAVVLAAFAADLKTFLAAHALKTPTS